MVLDTSLLNTQHYKVRIKGKVEQYSERSFTPLHFNVIAIEKKAFESLPTTVTNFTYIYICVCVCVCVNPRRNSINQKKEDSTVLDFRRIESCIASVLVGRSGFCKKA